MGGKEWEKGSNKPGRQIFIYALILNLDLVILDANDNKWWARAEWGEEKKARDGEIFILERNMRRERTSGSAFCLSFEDAWE
jgi:hypothetical protein